LSKPVDSLLRPGHNCCAVAHSARAAFLVDAQAYFLAFLKAAERAERSILILAWDFDSRTRLDMDAGERGASIGTFLNQLVRRRKRLRVHILDWDFPMIFGHDREFPPLYGLNWRPHRRVRLRYDDTHPLAGSHHQKMVVIDDRVAFVGGLDLTLRRWDTPAHHPDDPRRVALGNPYPPFHDTMVMVDGHAARALGEIARNRWRIATGAELVPPAAVHDPWPPEVTPDVLDVRVGIACTAPGVNGHAGTREVEQLYLDMIAASRRYIVMENQYFTSRAIGDALAARLAAAKGPEIVLVTRLLSHGWLEEVTMHTLRARLIERLRAVTCTTRISRVSPRAPASTCTPS
jgi:phosphatidylserine/phosphatidylglycerophosphate/cardiolipin synthase-like enzyme